MADIIIIFILILVVGWACRTIYRKNKNGIGCSCCSGGSCNGACSGSCTDKKKTIEEK